MLTEGDLLQQCISRLETLRDTPLPPGHVVRRSYTIFPSTPRSVIKGDIQRRGAKVFSSFNQASGAVSCLASNLSENTPFDSSDFSLLVGSCCNQQPEYNRIGELQLYKRALASSSSVRALDGHGVDKAGHARQRRTVSAVTYSRVADRFLSAGYDGTIALWQTTPSSNESLAMAQISSKMVLDISAHPSQPAVFYGTSSGQLGMLKIDHSAQDDFGQPHTFNQSPLAAGKDALTNWVDRVHAAADGQRLYFGINWHSAYRSGVLQAWSLTEDRFEGNIAIPGMGLSAMAAGCSLLAIGTGDVLLASGPERQSRGTGLIDIYQANGQIGSPPCITLKTSHYDVDTIALSPDERFIAIGDAYDHAWSLFDVCYPSRPLATGSCRATERCEEVMAMAFSPESDTLYVGGQDGYLYYYDVIAGTVADKVSASSPINCILPLNGPVAVGCETGAVQLLGVQWPDTNIT